MKDIYNNLKVVTTIDPIVGKTDTHGTGVGVDRQGYEGALIVAHIGASGDTLGTSVNILPVAQESDSLASGYTAVAPGDLLGAFTLIDSNAKDEVVQVVGYRGNKRYIRLFVDFTGTHTNGTPISGVVILGLPRHAPTTATQLP